MKSKKINIKKAVLMGVYTINTSTSSFEFKLDSIENGDFKAGQFITFDLPISEKKSHRLRSYSIASAPDANSDQIELCIERVEKGKASQYLFNEIKVGDSLSYKGPHGTFHLDDTSDERLVFICTGTGIAPFRSMILDLEKRSKLNIPVHLIFGCRYESEILYRNYFLKLKSLYPNFTYDTCLSRDKNWPGVKKYVHEVYLNYYQNNIENTTFYLCGWSGMIDEARQNLKKTLNVNTKNIKFELYGISK